MFELAISFVLGAGVGCMVYRYMLKRDPVALEQWAQEVKAKYEALKRKKGL